MTILNHPSVNGLSDDALHAFYEQQAANLDDDTLAGYAQGIARLPGLSADVRVLLFEMARRLRNRPRLGRHPSDAAWRTKTPIEVLEQYDWSRFPTDDTDPTPNGVERPLRVVR